MDPRALSSKGLKASSIAAQAKARAPMTTTADLRGVESDFVIGECGVRIDWRRDGAVVTSSVIEKTIRKLMESEEGNEMRKRAKKIGEDVRRSMEEGGVTRMEIDAFVAHITREIN